MSWVTFNVKQQNASSLSDGEANFSWGFDQSTPPNLTNVSLQYKVSANAPARTLITLAAVTPLNGQYDLGTFDFPNNNKVVIPAAPPYNGGSYNQLVNVVFIPSTTSPDSSGTISGTFQNKVGPAGTDPEDCNWDAAATTPVPEEAKKAAY